ncbi:MAG: hypothetical protein OXI53_07805 [Nitrospira sp.]|nr:hypothetical protein [Nitrospira sp.]MDE0405204.1 hypothetical protein [Nitrospira sp.]MDE0485838.1 hypothetical protein [Nitrospira sp.]
MRKTIPVLLVGVIVIEPDYALAYIDPSAGGLLVQILLGGIAGIGVLVKLYWGKLTKFFRKEKDDRP